MTFIWFTVLVFLVGFLTATAMCLYYINGETSETVKQLTEDLEYAENCIKTGATYYAR